MKLVITFLATLIVSIQAFSCWNCEDAKSIEACARDGFMQECEENQTACETLHSRAHERPYITMRCQEPRYCGSRSAENQHEHNLELALPSGPISTCKCCCTKNLCNRGKLSCGMGPSNPDIPFPVCVKAEVPGNGSIACNGSIPQNEDFFLEGATCRYSCDEGFALEGNEYVTCSKTPGLDRPIFNPAPPICKPCRQLVNTTSRQVSCSNGNLIGSECTFTCSPGRVLSPRDRNTAVCQSNAEWTTVPCCALQVCNTAVDLVIILDSSRSIGRRRWPLFTNFTKNLIRKVKELGRTEYRIAVFSFNTRVNTRTAIRLNTTDNTTVLLNLVEKIRYNSGITLTGLALKWARESILTLRNGDRPNVPNAIIVLTDGLAQKESLLKEQADLLHAKGTTMYALYVGELERGKNGEKSKQEKQLEMIASNPSFVRSVAFNGLDEDLANDLGQEVCEAVSCSVAARRR